MPEILEVVKSRWVTITEPAALMCDGCGCGATVGSEAAKNWPEPGMRCWYCSITFGRVSYVYLQPEQQHEVRELGYTVLRCDCGEELVCNIGTFYTPCQCGRDYDDQGNVLAPREQWGWDTGETFEEIVAPMTEEDLW